MTYLQHMLLAHVAKRAIYVQNIVGHIKRLNLLPRISEYVSSVCSGLDK